MDLLKKLNNMITAEDFLRYKSNINEDKNCVEYLKDSEVEDIMIEFAKLHVEEALKQAEKIAIDFDCEGNYDNSILNCYLPKNIK